MAGCQGPGVGSVVELKQGALLVLDRADYDQYAELKAAGADTKAFTGFISDDSLKFKHQWRTLDTGSRVRVLAHVPGGVKVVVEHAINLNEHDKKMDGTTGYIHLSDLP